MGAPMLARNMGNSGKIASLETSFRKLARPSSHTTRGNARSARTPRTSWSVRPRGGWAWMGVPGWPVPWKFLPPIRRLAEFLARAPSSRRGLRARGHHRPQRRHVERLLDAGVGNAGQELARAV